MKYFDANKLKIELKKRMGEYDVEQTTSEHPDYEHSEHPDYEQGAMDALYNLNLQLNILNLQPEQQVVEGVVHHVMNAHYIVTNQEQLNARLREIPEGTKVNIIIYEIKEEEK